MCPIYVLLVSTSLKFYPVSLYNKPFSRPFWVKCSEWPQNDIELHHICVTSIPESQMLVHFALRPAVSVILHILQFPIDSYVKGANKEQNKKPRGFDGLHELKT